MRIVFLGTPDFAVATLERLAQSSHTVVAVITQPDRLGNRQKLFPPAVKVTAESLGIPVYQYERISREGVSDLVAMNADVFVTCAFGQILSREILAIPQHGILNVHASILPLYRGSCPIQASIIAGDTVTGVTIMRTEYEVDSGDVLLVKTTAIDDSMTAGELFDKLQSIGADALIEALDLIESGEAVYQPQDASQATFCHMLCKADGEIDWSKNAVEVHNHVRGMSPWPGAFTSLDSETIKVHSTRVIESDSVNSNIGEIQTSDGRLIVSCSSGSVEILELQMQGGKRMRTSDYLRGHKIADGKILGKN